jgi:hypothetical protein
VSELTVVCWKWKGWRNVYKAEHVNLLEHMLAKHLHIPHRLVCVTDDPAGVNCETMPIWDYPQVEVMKGRPNCFRRLRVFAPEAKEMFGERLLSIDLDCMIFDDITPLITQDDFKITAGTAAVAPYNGSMFLHKTGTRPELWDDFDPATFHETIKTTRLPGARPFYGSDQAWMSYRAPGEATWGPDDGVYFFRHLEAATPNMPRGARIVFFPGSAKPWDHAMKRRAPAVRRAYQQYLEEMNS